MKRALLLAGICSALCSLLAFPVLAQAQSPQTAPSGTASPSADNGSAEGTPSTEDFVKNAAIGGLFEIQSSKLALLKREPAERQFASHMIHDHEQIAAQLKRLVRKEHVQAKIPNTLDDEHKKMLDQLRGESGQNFDKDYDQMQQQGHEQAVALFQSYANNGDNPALKAWAAKTLPELQNHLDMAKKLS